MVIMHGIYKLTTDENEKGKMPFTIHNRKDGQTFSAYMANNTLRIVKDCKTNMKVIIKALDRYDAIKKTRNDLA